MPAQRARLIPILATPALLFAGAGVLAPAAGAATSKLPAVTKFSPLVVTVGDKLSVKGTRFRVGVGKNTVVFKRDGEKAVFVKVTAPATKKRLSVVVPKTLDDLLKVKDGVKVATRFRIRVLSARFGKSYTTLAKSPIISPGKVKTAAGSPLIDPLFPVIDGSVLAPGDPTLGAGASTVPITAPLTTIDPVSIDPNQPGAAPSDVVCKLGIPALGDADGDTLSDLTEGTIGTNPLCADTDGDLVLDGYEYLSALDLNPIAYAQGSSKVINYQNALDPTDAGTDFDGDGLTQLEEQNAWIFEGKPTPISYSDGKPATTGGLRDGDRDVDLDGLSNWAEQHGPLTPEWWKAMYDGATSVRPLETPYPNRTYVGLSAFKNDTDADGIDDYDDDEDHDGYSNGFEAYRPGGWVSSYVSTTRDGGTPTARVQPFNPCKPTYSSFCHDHPPFSIYPDEEDWASPVYRDGP